MISKRAFLAGGAASLIPRRMGRDNVIATVVMTFDSYLTTYTNALWDMSAKGIPGTFFVDSSRVGLSGQPSKDNLVLMAAIGWEIGARVYGHLNGSEANMVAMWVNNRGAAADRLKAQKDEMYALGFDIKSISTAQRAWSTALRGVASHLFENVRVADHVAWGGYPIGDRLYVRDGATDSWSCTDTGASLSAQLDQVIAANGIWIPVIHKVSDPVSADPNFTVSFDEFKIFTSYLQSKIAAGVVRAVTFRDAMLAP